MTKIALRSNGGRVAVPGFSNLIENLFQNDFPTFLNNEWMRNSLTSVNIKDVKDAYHIEVAAPGFAKDSFNVKIEDSVLTISAEAKEDKLEEGEKFTRKEFVHSSFVRSFTLPKTIVADKIAANYENGILKVSLPKMEEAKSKGTIDVKIS
ncbi:MAG: Hsp20/alpha crystallin family protein [Bacteroidetes bacterium]|nr:Hsp20/alpha crystallin family protein [Bacteroidota bacterium]